MRRNSARAGGGAIRLVILMIAAALPWTSCWAQSAGSAASGGGQAGEQTAGPGGAGTVAAAAGQYGQNGGGDAAAMGVPGPDAFNRPQAPPSYGWNPAGHNYMHHSAYGRMMQQQYGPQYQPDNPSMYPQRPYGRTLPPSNVGYAPPGLVLPLTLVTAISSRSTKEGDHIQATVSRNVALNGNAYIPAGSLVEGDVTRSHAAGFLDKGGELNVIFNKLSLPDGRSFPISAQLLGGLGTVGSGDIPYSDVHGGEGWRQRAEQMGFAGGVGNFVEGGAGLAWAPAMGQNFVRGLYSGTSIMGFLALAGGALRHGRNVIVPSGSNFEIRLDNALTITNPVPPMPGSGF